MILQKLKALTARENDLFLLGETLIDINTKPSGEVRKSFGGSCANITINLRRLGFKANLCSAVGKDEEGQYLLRTMMRHGVNTTCVRSVDARTSEVYLRTGQLPPKPRFLRHADYHIAYTPTLKHLIKRSKIFHFSYWPLTREPAKSVFFKALKDAVDANLVIAFDPNIHPDLLSDESLTPKDLMGFLSSVDIMKPSLDDAARLFGSGLDKSTYMDRFEALGIPLVLMTLGSEGVFVSHYGKRMHVPTKPVEIVDPTGAGDAFWAGFYAGLLKNLPLEDVLHHAQRIGATPVGQVGALAKLPHFSRIMNESSWRNQRS